MSRSSHLSDRAKSWLGIVFGILLIALFIASFFSGRQPDPKPQPVQQQQAEQPVHQYAPPATDETNTAGAVKPISEEALTKVQEILPAFLHAYVPFDEQDPQAYLEKSKPYVTERLYEHFTSGQRRGTLTSVQTEVRNIELTPAELGQAVQWWNADIGVRYTDSKGNQEDSELLYTIKAKLVDGFWKVDDVGVRTGAWGS
ncbi:hypothetical protein KM868_09545 [Micrococcus luteus]|uniref:hypothetical protein n=1 Tax=Bacillus subtilis TaxID=1423 RepID=UPI001C250718|nr:hypothetical protein [Micrococcus luteus]